jgi:segregation and condensation protein B
VLALVAYHQPVSKREIEKLMGGPCSGSLNQLLRRNLISLTKEPAPVGAVYRTTSRFLDLFDLESLDDLPRSESWES